MFGPVCQRRCGVSAYGSKLEIRVLEEVHYLCGYRDT